MKKSLSFILRETDDKRVIPLSIATIPFHVLDRLVGIYMLAEVVGAASQGQESRIILLVICFAGYRFISETMQCFLDTQLQTKGYSSKLFFLRLFAAKYMQVDYAYIESIDGKDTARRAKNAMAGTDYRDKSAVERFFVQSANLISDFCGLFIYTGIIAALNPVIILLLATTALINFVLQKTLVSYDQRDKVRYIPIERKLWYLVKEMRDLSGAKDIRMYGMGPWLRAIFTDALKKRMQLHAKRSRIQFAFIAITTIVNALFTGYIYYFLIHRCLLNAISIAQFLLYFGLITGFNAWVISITDGIEELRRTLLLIEDLRVFIKRDEKDRSVSPKEKTSLSEGSIYLDHVSFTYDGEKNVLNDISIGIDPGEKIAIVGANGAGKTTLVKLITGLYTPSAGTIYIDGSPLATYSKEELYKRISVIFQDIHLLPTTIKNNIVLSTEVDESKWNMVVEKAGLYDKIQRLADHENTLLVKSIQENAIELSGGEEQKLAFARALYRDGNILILDEPTAKLDPMAEDALYQNYAALSEQKTAIFISHRLSSTRFCDRILLIENGVIAENGSHDELMQLGGLYANMFEIQSQYYQDEVLS